MTRKRHDYIPRDKYETEFWAIELLKVSKKKRQKSRSYR
jgi:hypothetical protein